MTRYRAAMLMPALILRPSRITTSDVVEPLIDADDIADVAIAALIEDGHAGQIYEVTGPRVLTFPEAVEEIAGASAATSATCRSHRSSTPWRCGRPGSPPTTPPS